MTNEKKISAKLRDGIEQKAYTEASCLLGQKGQVLLKENTTTNNSRLFDLASLTKPLCTALITLKLVDEKKISLTNKVSDFFETTNLCNTTIAELLNHTSGLIDWKPFYENLFNNNQSIDFNNNKKNILNQILNDSSLINEEQNTKYSDLGYMVLGQILESIGQDSLDQLFVKMISKPLGIENEIFFNSLTNKKSAFDFVPSETCPTRNKIIEGEVMDLNSWVQGGVTGHAGLFGTATGIHKVLKMLRESLLNQNDFFSFKNTKIFLTPHLNRNSSSPYFTLGFDTKTEGTSQSGTLMSLNTIGHLGYAGTSFWWDLDRDFWIILLTNRCMIEPNNPRLKTFRPQFYDFVIQELNL